MVEEPETLVIGVDVGGTSIKTLLVEGESQVLREHRVRTPRSGPGVVDRVADAVNACVAELTRDAPRRPVAIGLAVPGIVNEEKGLAVYSENLGWNDAPLRDMLAERCALPVAFGHDVRSGGLAEARIGAGRDYPSIVFVAIGTGISAALYLDGRAYTGHGYAGEIGHTDVGHGEPCVCGGTGCLEAIASAAAIARRYRERCGRTVTGSLEVLQRMRDGDQSAADVWHEALDALSLALSWTCCVLAPDALILGGGLAEAGDELLTPLALRVEARLTFQSRPRHLRAALGDRAAALGSALLARDLLATEAAA